MVYTSGKFTQRKRTFYLDKTAWPTWVQAANVPLPDLTNAPFKTAHCAHADQAGQCWVGTEIGLCVTDGNGFWRTPENTDTLPAEEIFCVAQDANGVLYLGSDCGVIILDKGVRKYLGAERWVPADKVNAIAVSPDGSEIWAATDAGISKIEAFSMTLEEKAAHYLAQIERHFTREGFIASKCDIKNEDLSTGRIQVSNNDGLWTGVFVAAMSMKYAATGDCHALELARKSKNAMLRLARITGIPGLPARAIRQPGEKCQNELHWHEAPDGSCLWKGDTSSDELSGHFFALPIYYDLCADEAEKQEIRQTLCEIIDYILANDLRLIDVDGTPTRWGNWNPDDLNYNELWVDERGINSLEILSFLKSALHVSGDEKYQQKYLDLIENHHYLLNAAHHKVPDYHITHHDDNLGFLATANLLRYEQNPDIRALLLLGLEHFWQYERVERAPFWNFVYAAHTGRPCDIEDGVQTLRELPLELYHGRVNNSNRRGLVYEERGERRQLLTPLPADERPVNHANPFGFDSGDGHSADNGSVMFLLPYWYGRWQGLLQETPPPKPEISMVWNKSDGRGYSRYRIPCIVATQRGTLLICCEARKDGGDWDPMDIVLKRSEDGGASWSDNQILVRGFADGTTLNNPVLIADGEFVHLLYCKEYGVAERGGGVFYMRSMDDGLTWSEPRDISASTHPDNYTRNVLACGPGHGLAHSNGALICPVWMTRVSLGEPHSEPGSQAHRPSDISTLYSLDRGESWQIGEVIYSTEDMPNMSECSAVELSDGRVMLNIRNEAMKAECRSRRAYAISPNGYSGWSKPEHDEALIDPVCYGSVARYDENTILFSNAASELYRENIVLRFSCNDGETWVKALTVDPGMAQYSDIAVMNGDIYVLYEKSPNIWLAKVEGLTCA